MNKYKLFWILKSFSVGMLVLLAACSDDSKSNKDTYYYIGSSCYNETDDEYVSDRYCRDNIDSSSFFEKRNGVCRFIETGEEMDSDYCKKNPFEIRNGYCWDKVSRREINDRFCDDRGRYDDRFGNNSSTCRGQHAYNNNGVTGYLNCDSYDCRGLRLLHIATNRVVDCR